MIRMSLKICLVIAALFGSVSSVFARDLPPCPSSGYKQNCFGTYTYTNGDKYVGGYKDDLRNGQGTYTFANGENYVGEFKDDLRNGQGTYTFANGENYVGKFKDDLWNGQGTYTFANGTVEEGIWKDDEFQYEQKTPYSYKRSRLQIAFVNYSKGQRKLIQSNLKDLGLYTSSIDGLYGNRTAMALSGYNKKHLGGSDLKVAANVKKLMDKVLALATAAKPITESEAVRFKQIKEEFGLNYYGGFIHSDRVPNTLFFFTGIQQNDGFEFRKALRNHDSELIVLSSPGGSVFEGLQTAGIIHDKNLKTYIPKKSLYGLGNCSSACSFMFFAGESRTAEGDLGVHQFYSGKASDEEKIRVIQKRAQFTVSEIIGFLNDFETPAWVYERMFQQSEMYYFTESELLQLETQVSEETKAQHDKAERFISDFRSAFVKIKD
jgi:hypothetical protein